MRQMNIFRRQKRENETPQEETLLFDLPDFEKLAGKYDAVIHIGVPGTGSAALQKFLFDNHSLLKGLGFYYPVDNQNNNGISYEQSKLSLHLEKNDLATAKSAFDNYLAQAKQNNLTLLLSEKSLYGYPNQLKEITLDAKCQILAFFRNPLESLFSHYNQAVKYAFVTSTFERFCQDIISSNNDRLTGNIFNQWRESYLQQNLLVLGYDPSLFEQIRIEMLFLAALGIDKNLFNTFQYTEKRINPSYDFMALELRRWLNFVLDKELFYYNHKIDWLLQNYSEQRVNRPAFLLQEHIPQELYLSLKDKFKETNASLDEILTSLNSDFLADNNTLDNESASERIKYDDSLLKDILETIIENDATTQQYLINRTTKTLVDKGGSYYVLRLADILGIDIQPYIDTPVPTTANVKEKPFFTKAQINVFLSKRAQPVNFLTQIAISMERHGDCESALLISEKTLELRPNAPGIIALHNRIKSKT